MRGRRFPFSFYVHKLLGDLVKSCKAIYTEHAATKNMTSDADDDGDDLALQDNLGEFDCHMLFYADDIILYVRESAVSKILASHNYVRFYRGC